MNKYSKKKICTANRCKMKQKNKKAGKNYRPFTLTLFKKHCYLIKSNSLYFGSGQYSSSTMSSSLST